jgi:hypothetical protein
MKSSHILLLATALTILSCKKDKQISKCATTYTESTDNDTVLPSSYLMYYPGSSWHYDDGSTITCNGWEQVAIVEKTTVNGCTTVHTTHKTAAVCSFGYVIGVDGVSLQAQDESTLLQPLLATTIGDFYDYHGTTGYGEEGGTVADYRTVTELLDSMTVLGVVYYDVIHVHSVYSTYYPHIFGGPHGSGELFYANHVGVIRSEANIDTNPTIIHNLVSYVIGPH